MSPKTRLTVKKNQEDAPEKKKNKTVARKKRATGEKKKKDSARDSGVDGGSDPTKRARNTTSPPEHQRNPSPAPSAEFPSQADSEGTPRPVNLSLPQKSPTQAPSEADNPLQPPITSLSVLGSSTKSPLHREDDHNEEIGPNNRDSKEPEAAIDNNTQRTVGEENMAVEPMRPVGFFFKPSEYGTVCKLSSRVTEADVLEKLLKMKADGSDERLKMVVLYFLTRVIRGKSKNGYFIEPFILQAWTFPGFIIPLEILTFECIPVLRERFRDPVPNCLVDCPRMCKWKFKRTGTTGFPLEDIYEGLGNTKVISSVLEPQGGELDLLYEIMDEGTVEDVELIHDSDKPDIVVDGWNRILVEPEGKIFWEDLFDMDVRTRPTTQQQSKPHGIFEGQEEERVYEEPEAGGEAGRESVKELELRLNKRMEDGFALRDEAICLLAKRSFQFGEYVTEAEKDGDKEVEKDGEKEVEKDGEKEGEDKGDKDGEKQVEEEAENDGEKEAEKDDAEGEEDVEKEAYEVADNEDEEGQKEGETEADKEGEKAEKEGETESDKMMEEDSPYTLEVMVEAAEKLEKEADEKAAAEKATDEEAASDKEKIGDEEETRPKRTHKPSRPLRSLYQPN
ncbi:hypothetical protein Bca52824_032748 [Brassica carinata]|uniref:DUF287 domain-containing protein n=1 Tax=Brassica carinata TaxID=52824 RepID=A0A8X7V6L1_BRACI|nr:hypothetical protein Bca52824_032748 [Brassica carinata]